MYQWNPEWERVKLRIGGRDVVLCRDRVTGLYVCPKCTNPETLCPEGQRVRGFVPEGTTYLATEADVEHHLRECERGLRDWGRGPRYEEEFEEEEEV